MKTRIPILLLVLSCLLTLVSCHNGSPFHLYDQFLEQMEQANGMDATTRTLITIKVGDESSSYDTRMTLRYNDDSIYILSNEIERLYVDGTLYLTMGESKGKQSISLEEFKERYGFDTIYLSFPEIPSDAVKKTMLTESGDLRFFTAKLDPTATKDFALDVYRTLMRTENESVLSSLSVQAIVVTPTFDQDGTIAKLHVKCEYRQVLEGETFADIIIDMYYTFIEPGVTPTVTAPADADAYLSIDDLDK